MLMSSLCNTDVLLQPFFYDKCLQVPMIALKCKKRKNDNNNNK